MARLLTSTALVAALAVSPAAFAFKKAETPPPVVVPETNAATPTNPTPQAGKEQGVAQPAPIPKVTPVAQPAVKAPGVTQTPAAPAPKTIAPQGTQKPVAAIPIAASPSAADAQKQMDAELAKLKALQAREAEKIKALPPDGMSASKPRKPVVSQESRDYLKGLGDTLEGSTK